MTGRYKCLVQRADLIKSWWFESLTLKLLYFVEAKGLSMQLKNALHEYDGQAGCP